MAAFAEFSPDVVLLDVQLPDCHGIDLLHQFKMYSETMAVIMMSGVGTFERVIESMKLGAETFLQKPFDYETLDADARAGDANDRQRRELMALRRGDAQDVRDACRASRPRSRISTRSSRSSPARRRRS